MTKSILITGATGGIGETMCHIFAQAGYTVAVGYHTNQSKADHIVNDLDGNDHIAVQCTITDTPSIRQARDRIQEHFGDLSVLVNNAGFSKIIPHDDLQALTDDIIDGILQVHMRGSFACVRELSPLFTDNSCVINISSVAAQTGIGSNIAYCAAKSGLETMTKSLARALAPKTRVMAVAPGAVATPFVQGFPLEWRQQQEQATPLQRFATPIEVGEAVLACVENLTFTTGGTIAVDGGRPLGTL